MSTLLPAQSHRKPEWFPTNVMILAATMLWLVYFDGTGKSRISSHFSASFFRPLEYFVLTFVADERNDCLVVLLTPVPSGGARECFKTDKCCLSPLLSLVLSAVNFWSCSDQPTGTTTVNFVEIVVEISIWIQYQRLIQAAFLRESRNYLIPCALWASPCVRLMQNYMTNTQISEMNAWESISWKFFSVKLISLRDK